MKWTAIWVEGQNVFQNQEISDPEYPNGDIHNRWDFAYEPFGPLTKGEFERRRKIKASLKAWWTTERRIIHGATMRQVAWERKWRGQLQDMYDAAIKEAQDNRWEYIQITQFWHRRYEEFWAAHDDSGDWEIIHGRVVRTKVYGKPCPPGTPKWQLTAEDHRQIDLMNRYCNWDYRIGWYGRSPGDRGK